MAPPASAVSGNPAADAGLPAPAYGPPDIQEEEARSDGRRYDSFGSRVGAVKWELGAMAALLTATNLPVTLGDPQPFRFKSEGLFGKNTSNIGVDKLAHAWNTHLFSEILYRRMARKTGGGPASARTAALLGLGLQTYTEIYDAFHKGSGFSLEDMAFNAAGAGFTILQHSVPGLDEKIDYRLLIVPNEDVITFRGRKHFEQQWFLVAVKGAGFRQLENSPLRYLEFHVGYHAEGFRDEDRAAGVIPQRKPFVGIGLNVAELFLKNKRGAVGGTARRGLEYLQIPYTALHID